MSLKYLFERIYVESATGYGIDLGIMYYPAIKGLRVGASLQNFGKMGALRSENSKLPFTARFGFHYLFPWQSPQISGGFASDVVYISNENVRIHLGTEWLVWSQIALRGGVLLGYESRNFSLGLGFKRSVVRLDYGFIPFGDDLGSTHRFTLSFVL
jgi:hypothetical protein